MDCNYPLEAASPEGILDVYVTVERYGAQIQDRGSAAHNIEGDPDVAEPQSKDPVAEEIVDPGKGHHQPTDKEVGDGQGGQEEIADPPQPAVGVNRHADQNVAGDGEENEDHEEKSCEYRRGSQENRRDTPLFNASPLEAPYLEKFAPVSPMKYHSPPFTESDPRNGSAKTAEVMLTRRERVIRRTNAATSR